jgi:exosortase E/protease (VPEID-CTERM system)
MPGEGRPATVHQDVFPHNRAAGRLAAVTLILLTEYLASATLLDIETLNALPAPFSFGWHGLAAFMTAVLAALVACVIFWRKRALAELARASAGLGGWDRAWLGIHGLAGLGLAVVTLAVVRVPGLAGSAGVPLLVLWFAFGALMTYALFRAAFAGALADMALRLSGVALAAAVVGLLAAAIPALVAPLWADVAVPTMYLTAVLLALSGRTVLVDPVEAVIELDGFAVQVYGPCSGVEGMGLVALFLAGYLWRFRADHRFPRALLILPAGVVLAFLANGLRIALLTAIGAYVDPGIAAGAFHSKAGWIFFCILTIGLVAVARSVPWFRAESVPAGAGAAADNPTAAYLMPLLVWLAVGLVASAWVSGNDPFYPLRVLLVLPVIWMLRRGIARALVSSGGSAGLSPGLAALAPWAIGLAVAALWLALSAGEPPQGLGTVAAAEGWTTGFLALWLVFRLVGTTIVVPVIEELAFRGYLQRRLVAADFTSVPQGRWHWGAVLVSAAVFGAMHGHWLAGFLAGAGFSLAAHLRGRLGDAILAHAVANALLAGWVLGFGRWDLW